MSRRRLIISAVNLVEGGTLTVLREFLSAAEQLGPEWKIVALVHDKRLVSAARAHVLELPQPKKSWLHRMYFEWLTAQRISRRLGCDVWVSLHDITSRVTARSQVVYCHNPSPFYRISLRECFYDPKFMLFSFFYGWLYRLRIKSNDAVVVQQEWLRDAFRRKWGVQNVIVAHPDAGNLGAPADPDRAGRATCRYFLYPALPRVFKNFELIGEALRLLETREDWTGEVWLTIDGSESRYAAELRRRYADVSSLKFLGRQDKGGMADLYLKADCLLFPSKLETWGLPITEHKVSGRPMIVADLPYARETVGDYHAAKFVAVDDPRALANAIMAAHQGNLVADRTESSMPQAPYAHGWAELLRLLAV